MPTINGKACVVNGRNLIIQSDLKAGYLSRDNGSVMGANGVFTSDDYIATNGATVFTFSSPDYAFKGSGNHTLAMYDSDKNYLGWQRITSPTQTLSNPNAAYIRFSITFINEGGTSGKLSDWLANHRYKLETGTTATPLTPAPVDKVFSNGKQVYGRNLFTGTSDKPSSITGGNWNAYNVGAYKTPKVGQEYTFSIEVPEADHDVIMQVYRCNNAGARVNQLAITHIKSGEKAHITFTWPDPRDRGATQIVANLAWTNGTDAGTYSYCKAKLETGNVATDWTPAPEDVM